tara:strand:+ start:1295 stop:1861 length:567 start_codon:yes stop_codon:yes gene_type:complete
MTYDLKNVFYLDTTVKIDNSTTGAGSAQLDLSAYIDPIARGRTKGTGLAIYKTHFTVIRNDAGSPAPQANEAGIMSFGLCAGLGVGDNATGTVALSDTLLQATNNLLITQGMYYGPASFPGATAFPEMGVVPSEKVPYVVVRDNVCLVYDVDATNQFTADMDLAVRMECAQVSLDQATLNQLLRTQTV